MTVTWTTTFAVCLFQQGVKNGMMVSEHFTRWKATWSEAFLCERPCGVVEHSGPNLLRSCHSLRKNTETWAESVFYGALCISRTFKVPIAVALVELNTCKLSFLRMGAIRPCGSLRCLPIPYLEHQGQMEGLILTASVQLAHLRAGLASGCVGCNPLASHRCNAKHPQLQLHEDISS